MFLGEMPNFEEANRENLDAIDESCRRMRNIMKMIEEFQVPRLSKPKVAQTLKIQNLPPPRLSDPLP